MAKTKSKKKTRMKKPENFEIISESGVTEVSVPFLPPEEVPVEPVVEEEPKKETKKTWKKPTVVDMGETPVKPKKSTKVDKDLVPIPRPSVESLIERAKAKLGKEGVVIRTSKELETRFDLRRPSGILSLDLATGGGLPAGLCQIDGVDGSGKNLLLNYHFAHVQEVYGEDTAIFMACLEFRYDKEFARRCGLKVAYSEYEIDMMQRVRHKIGKPPLTSSEIDELMDEIGKIVVIEGGTEEILEATVTFIESNRFQIGGIDSWDAMLPNAVEKVDLVDDPKIAASASLQTRWMNKVHAAMQPKPYCPICHSFDIDHKTTGPESYTYYCTNPECKWKGQKPKHDENETTIVGIRQARARMNRTSMRQSELQTTGACSLRHGKLIDIKISRGEYIMQGNERVGKEINWELTKGKAGTHEGKKGSFRYLYDPPRVETNLDLIETCLRLSVISRAGAWYEFDMGGRKIKVKSKAELEDVVEREPGAIISLKEAALQAVGLDHIRYR